MHKKFILGIGSQRAGSTFISRLLDQHSKIAIHPIKELHYFDTLFGIRSEQALKSFSQTQLAREINRLHKSPNNKFINPRWKWYVKSNFHLLTTPVSNITYDDLFETPRNMAKVEFLGESTPEYMLLEKEHVMKVRDTVGDAYVIIICRNPIKRIISSFRLFVEYNGCNGENLDALFLKLISSENLWLENQMRYSRYCHAVENYSSSFDKLLVLSFDDIVARKHVVVEQLSNFLGVSFDASIDDFFSKKINSLKVKYSPSEEVSEMLESIFSDFEHDAEKLFGKPLKY